MISVVVPAHNEEAVIEACLHGLMEGGGEDELEVLVVCNGCTDATVARANTVAGNIRVVESSVASKAHAINIGLKAAGGGTIVVMDADVRMSAEDVRRLADGIVRAGALAGAPAVRMEYLPGTSPVVHGYYRIWLALPYVREGMMAAGVYALSARGRQRVGELPPVIADDGYVRLLFDPSERIEVTDAFSIVLAPLTVVDLVKIKTRSRLGGLQLRRMFPHLHMQTARHRRVRAAAVEILSLPSLWWSILPYLYVNIVSRVRAGFYARRLSTYKWEKDEGSRRGFAGRNTSE